MRTLKPFDYFEPETVQEATKLLSKRGKKSRILAGGVDLIPRMRSRKMDADVLINIQKIPELRSHSMNEKKE